MTDYRLYKAALARIKAHNRIYERWDADQHRATRKRQAERVLWVYFL